MSVSPLQPYSIIYRDLKPDNIGFDVRGDTKLFDFGLAKELLPRDLVLPPDGYDASGLTGSRRYMVNIKTILLLHSLLVQDSLYFFIDLDFQAPEVVLCKEYGLSADVYSYAILFWQVMALEMPFMKYDTDQHFTRVVLKGERPRMPSFLSPMVARLLEECWSGDRRARPGFKRICETLKAEICTVESSTREMTDRTSHLMDSSYNSRYGLS